MEHEYGMFAKYCAAQHAARESITPNLAVPQLIRHTAAEVAMMEKRETVENDGDGDDSAKTDAEAEEEIGAGELKRKAEEELKLDLSPRSKLNLSLQQPRHPDDLSPRSLLKQMAEESRKDFQISMRLSTIHRNRILSKWSHPEPRKCMLRKCWKMK